MAQSRGGGVGVDLAPAAAVEARRVGPLLGGFHQGLPALAEAVQVVRAVPVVGGLDQTPEHHLGAGGRGAHQTGQCPRGALLRAAERAVPLHGADLLAEEGVDGPDIGRGEVHRVVQRLGGRGTGVGHGFSLGRGKAVGRVGTPT